MSLSWLFEALHWLGVTVYCGSVLSFALVLGLAMRVDRLDEVAVMNVYRAWGAILGLSMGALIFGGLGAWTLAHDGFSWPQETLGDQLSAIKQGVFLVLWVSSFHLEIWTLDPIRKLQDGGAISDRAAWDRTFRRVVGQLTLNSVLILVIGGLAIAAAH